MLVLYNLLLTLLAPFWVPWMWWRTRRRAEGVNWRERAGDFPLEPRADGKRIWIHAVSVGEVVAGLPILRELRALLPDHEIVLSVTTSSGHQTAREQAADLVDHLIYFPIDVARFQLAAMQRVRPAVVAILETELWMNFLWAAKTFRARTLLVNGRLSDRGYRGARRVGFFYRALLRDLDRCLMQSETDAERIRSLGAQDVVVLGNAKFDQAVEGLAADPADWRQKLGIPTGEPVLVVGSTRGEEEEAFVAEALRDLPVAIVWAPRHLERADALADLLARERGGVARRSLGEGGSTVLLDTYGELSSVYSIADLVIIGGGFANHGGQNLIQPLAHGVPVLHGPHMQNFRASAEAAQTAGATEVASTPRELREAVQRLLNDPSRRERMGAAGKALVRAGAGAGRRYAEAIQAAATDYHAEERVRRKRKPKG